ncbi:MAG TPA: ATP-binding protein [Hyphomicrobiales bacterium]|nr:ATP-binding protein [Hyphomicrobiales bacterium]
MVGEQTLTLWQRLLMAVGLPAVVTVAGALPFFDVSNATLLLLYLCVVLFVALRADQRTVQLCTLFCYFSFVYHAVPLLNLGTDAAEEVLNAVLFVVIGSLAGTIAMRLRSQLSSLMEQKEFLHQQLALSQQLNKLDDTSTIPLLITEHFGHLFGHLITFRLATIELGGKLARQQLTWDFEDDVFIKADWAPMLLSLREQVQGALIQRATEQARKEAERRSDEDKMRTSLLSSVSHDLKTPLVTMLGAATTLRDLRADLRSEDADELLGSIIAESERLEAYIQNLLEMTRLGHGELPLVRDWVSMEEIYHVTEKRLARQHHTERLQLELAPGLPVLHVHAALVEQGLFNAVDNALKASRPDGEVLLRVSLQDNAMQILVCDQGPGLPASEWERVFNPFYTFSLGDCYDKGTGLGLSICRSIFRLHGGEARIIPAPAPYRHSLCLSLPLPDTTLQPTDHEDDDDPCHR